MADKDKYVSIADLKAKLRYWCKSRGASKQVQESLMGTIKHIPYTVRADVSATLDSTGWIPCSERLPENNQRVIFTGYDPDLYICCDDGSNNYILVGWYKAEQGRGKSLGYKSLRKGFYAENPKGTSTMMHEDFVTHWMPLPEPPESEVVQDADD